MNSLFTMESGLKMPVKVFNPLLIKQESSEPPIPGLERQQWLKKEFTVFMKSVSILNQGLSKLKSCHNPATAVDITSDTYVALIKDLMATIGPERKADMHDRLVEALSDDESDYEEMVHLPMKRQRIPAKHHSITDVFKFGQTQSQKSSMESTKAEFVHTIKTPSSIAHTPSMVDADIS